jgi:hypothetical protein
MHRMGHASIRAAMIYQHATSERDREIARGRDERITKGSPKKAAPKKSTRRKKGDDDGSAGSLARVG